MSLRVGVTQRVDVVREYGERRDALDQAWIAFLAECELEPLIIPNMLADPAMYVQEMGVGGIILTGGNNFSNSIRTIQNQPVKNLPQYDNNTAPERDVTEVALLKHSIDKGWPVIGVCRGMQLLNLFHEGEIRSVKNHVGLYHELTVSRETEIVYGRTFDKSVNSFHDYGIDSHSVSSEFNILAQSGDIIESFIHRKYSHLGIMWHPERNDIFSVNDIELFHNYFKGGIEK